tara:strand:+ start:18311 stop:21382 length:3072 start_codon:yes stop_codon:yes gene_type:complete
MSRVNPQDLKTSLLINRQVPEFIREDHPLFISFLEAYYEFLETEQGTQNNDLTKVSKDLRYLSDIDTSLESFETNFLNNYANLIPKDITVDKAFLIKNVLPLYLAKGSPRSFQFLFRMFFAQEVELKFGKDKTLRASDSDYKLENILSVREEISSFYTGDGSNNVFHLAQPVSRDEIVVRINGVVKSSNSLNAAANSDFIHVERENQKLIFHTIPVSGADIKVTYTNQEAGGFDETLLVDRKIIGQTSNASAIVSTAVSRIIESLHKVELFLDSSDISGNFDQSEELRTNIVVNGSLVNISLNTISSIETIKVNDGGTSYNVGDIIPINAGAFQTQARAEVEKIFTDFARDPEIFNRHEGGSGFELGSFLTGGNTEIGFINFKVETVDKTGNNTPNTFTMMGTSIDTNTSSNTAQSFADLCISNAAIGGTGLNNAQISLRYSQVFGNSQIGADAADSAGINVNTSICHVVNSYTTISEIGPAKTVLVVTSTTQESNVSNLDQIGALVSTSANVSEGPAKMLPADVTSLRGIGSLNIINGGTFHNPRDMVEFSDVPFGGGATARVCETAGGGSISNICLEDPYYVNEGPVRTGGSANVGFNGQFAIPNCYTFGANTANSPDGNNALYMTRSSFLNGMDFTSAPHPVKAGDRITFLGYERQVVEVNTAIGSTQTRGSGFIKVDIPFPADIDFRIKQIGGNTSQYGDTSNTFLANTANTFHLRGAPLKINQAGPKGGTGYRQDRLPTISVFRSIASNGRFGPGGGDTLTTANVQVVGIMGRGTKIHTEANTQQKGIITSIKLDDFGSGYQVTPSVDLTTKGDGNALAVAELLAPIKKLPGRFTSSKGLISADERRIQGANIYNDFAYITNIPLEFDKYKTIVKGLIHPAGYKNFAEFKIEPKVETNVTISSRSLSNSIPGLINIANPLHISNLFNVSTQTIITISSTTPNANFVSAKAASIIVEGQSRLGISNDDVNAVGTNEENFNPLIIKVNSNNTIEVNSAQVFSTLANNYTHLNNQPIIIYT